jgi:hypothetical protein
MNANGLVRCTECPHYRGMGTWCPEARKHAGGKWLRRCAHFGHPAPATLEHLRALPGVAEAEHREGRLWVRFHRDATSEQRDRLTEALTGRRPQARAPPMPRAGERRRGNGRRPPQGTPPQEGNAA